MIDVHAVTPPPELEADRRRWSLDVEARASLSVAPPPDEWAFGVPTRVNATFAWPISSAWSLGLDGAGAVSANGHFVAAGGGVRIGYSLVDIDFSASGQYGHSIRVAGEKRFMPTWYTGVQARPWIRPNLALLLGMAGYFIGDDGAVRFPPFIPAIEIGMAWRIR